jgi:phosphohistidine phosphatase
MTRELLILRHGKSSWDTGADDFDRPLEDRGKRGAQRVGVWLWQQDLRPDAVISSPAERALVTAQKVCKAMGQGSDNIVRDRRVYAASLTELLEVLADAPVDAPRVMLVGHNPGLEELVLYLTDNQFKYPDDGKLLPTATVALLDMPDAWSELNPGSADLRALIRPKTLPKKFPFPAPFGEEGRDRPAYYYNQSSVVPFRVEGGQPEVLLVTSSKNRHWVVPKGIKDPGLSPQDSAAKEAFEEAGVEGEVINQSLGRYDYAKWGATCTVEVFPMRVTSVLSEDTWEESHRQRQWFTPQEASEKVRQAELAPMILRLGEQFGG